MKPISIKFPLVSAPSGSPRPDKAGLSGAAMCAASLVTSAIIKRDQARREKQPAHVAFERASMRSAALEARVFAGQLQADDPRLSESRQRYHALAHDILSGASLRRAA